MVYARRTCRASCLSWIGPENLENLNAKHCRAHAAKLKHLKSHRNNWAPTATWIISSSLSYREVWPEVWPRSRAEWSGREVWPSRLAEESGRGVWQKSCLEACPRRLAEESGREVWPGSLAGESGRGVWPRTLAEESGHSTCELSITSHRVSPAANF